MELAVTAPSATRAAHPHRLAAAAVARQGAFLALCGVVVLSPFRARIVLEERPVPAIFRDYTDLLLFWNEILILVAIGLWLLGLLLQPRRIDAGPALIALPVALLAVAVCASVPFAVDGKLALFNAVTLLGFMVFALFVMNEVRSVSALVPAVGLMIAIQAVVAITQLTSQASAGLGPWGEMGLDPAVRGVSILWAEGEPLLLRAYGMSDHPNILGGVLAASMLVLAAGFSRLRDEWLVLAAGIFAAGAAALFATFSRAGALGLAAGVLFAVLVLLARRDWRSLRVWLAACLIAAIVTVPFVVTYLPYLEGRVNPAGQPVGSPEERSLTEREALARTTGEMFLDRPLSGVGAGVLPTAMREAYPEFEFHYFPAHLAILVVAAETGALGLAAYGALMLTPWVLLWLRRHRLTPELIAVSGALLALQVVGLFDYYIWSLDAGRIWFWLVVGLWVVAYRNAVTTSSDRTDASTE